MTQTPAWRRYLRFWGPDLAADVDDEVRFHIESHVETLIAEGMSPEAARAEVLRRFGDVRRVKRAVRAMDERHVRADRRAASWEALRQDVAYGVRSLRMTPAFSAIAVLTLALGIGANTAIFSVINGVLLRPLPFPHAERLARISTRFTGFGFDYSSLSEPELLDFQRETRSFEVVAGFASRGYGMTGEGEPERVGGLRATATIFRVLGIQAARGRVFLPEEDAPGHDGVVVISDALWRRRFGADPAIVGRTIALNGIRRTVVGVLPRSFDFRDLASRVTDVIVPLALNLDTLSGRSAHYLEAIARLKPGVPVERASAEAATIAARLTKAYPSNYPEKLGFGATVRGLRDSWVGSMRPALLVLAGAVGFVLLIACANVANLLLARGEARQRELAIRVALGAGRARIVRQLLTESVLLALVGAAVGLLLAPWGVNALLSVNPQGLPLVQRVSVDVPVLAVTLVLTLATALLFGMMPALEASRADVHVVLKEGGRGTAGGRRGQRTRAALVAGQVALAVVVVTGAGLLLKSFWRLQRVDPGFDSSSALAFDLALPAARYKSDSQVVAFYERLLERLAALPGVEAAGAVTIMPLSGETSNWDIEIEGRPETAAAAPVSPNFQIVAGDYFRTMRIPLRQGRAFLPSDDGRATPVVVINEMLAREQWPGRSALGARIRVRGSTPAYPWMTVVGIVADSRQRSLRQAARAEYFLPVAQAPTSAGGAWGGMTLIARTRAEPASLAASARRATWSIDPDLALANVRTLRELVADSVAQPRFTMLLVLIFGAVALVIAAIGVYGVVAYSVSRRTREVGIRLALGARPVDVVRLIVSQGMVVAGVGIALGVSGALVITRALAKLLYGVSATDPWTFAAIALLLAAVAAVATYLPARRATRIDPTLALRGD
jgi:putative ABC transport system permease protein